MAPSRPCVPAPPPAASSRGRCPRPNPDAANSSYSQRGPGLSCRLEEAPEVIRRSLSTSTCVRKVGRLFFLLFTRCPERDGETAAAGPRAWTVVQAPVCPRRRRCVNKRPASPHGAAHTGSFRPRPDPPAGRETRVFAPPHPPQRPAQTAERRPFLSRVCGGNQDPRGGGIRPQCRAGCRNQLQLLTLGWRVGTISS